MPPFPIRLAGIAICVLFTSGSLDAQEKVLSAGDLAARIDLHLGDKWAQASVQPAPMAEDGEWLRRVYLDLTGRIPRVSEVREFLGDQAGDKRAKLMARLIASPLYVTHLSTSWREILLPPSNNQQFQFLNPSFKNWLDQQVRANTSYDQMVKEILTTPVFNQGGRVGFNPQLAANVSPAAFYQVNEFKPENLAASTSRVFLGVRMECAQCHDHPFAPWTQTQFWELAAFFSGMQQLRPMFVNGQVVQPKVAAKKIRIPGKDKEVGARFPDGTEPSWRDKADPRDVLADWVVSPKNVYFARNGVNRVWAHFFGVGLIDPVDDEPTGDNPISHPELLDELTQQFIAHKFDIQYLMQAILASKAYQRSSEQTHPGQAQPRLFARMSLRGLSPEQFFDSLALAVGYRDPANLQQQRFGFPAFNTPRGEFLNRFASQDRVTEKQTSILQALSLMNGKFIADSTSLQKSVTLGAVIEAPFLSTAGKVETLYLATLSRFPRSDEMQRLTAYVEQGGPRNDPNQALADVFWALLNSSEFSFNH